MNTIAITAATTPLAATSSAVTSPPASKKTGMLWAARICTGISALFLSFDVIVKLLQLEPAMKGTTELGYPPSAVLTIGLLGAVALVLYLVPRTAILGAVLWTGYFGGAIATHLRVGNPLFSHELAPVYVAVLVWAGIWCREPRLRAIFPLRAPEAR